MTANISWTLYRARYVCMCVCILQKCLVSKQTSNDECFVWDFVYTMVPVVGSTKIVITSHRHCRQHPITLNRMKIKLNICAQLFRQPDNLWNFVNGVETHRKWCGEGSEKSCVSQINRYHTIKFWQGSSFFPWRK